MARVADDHGKLDVLVNAAGIEIEKTIEETSLEEWNLLFRGECDGDVSDVEICAALDACCSEGRGEREPDQLWLLRRVYRRSGAGGLLRDEGGGACFDAGDGLRPWAGGHSGECDLSRVT